MTLSSWISSVRARLEADPEAYHAPEDLTRALEVIEVYAALLDEMPKDMGTSSLNYHLLRKAQAEVARILEEKK